MQFFLANLYSERLSAVSTTEPTTPSPATTVAIDDARLAEPVLVGSR